MLSFYLILLALLVVGIILTFNHLVKLRFLMKEAWSGIDVQLKRRHDLIPNLVEVVKGYAGHEKTLLEEISRQRSACMSTQQVNELNQSESQLTGSLKSLFALVENYPDLKADKNFRELQSTLTEVEDHLQMARRYYNGTVRNYNIMIESFPSSLVAQVFKFKGAEYFELESLNERETPTVTL